MGIRYYAYAFDSELSQQAVDDPYSIVSDDPLADAWGLVPRSTSSAATFEQTVPRQEMLYLDKAWRALQQLTAPARKGVAARPCYRMFEGQVSMNGLGWDAWVRTLLPDEIPAISDDLNKLEIVEALDHESTYVEQYLRSAREFVSGLAARRSGMVYLIG